MITITPNTVLELLVAFAILYALWTMYFFISENRRFQKENRETMLREQDSKKNKSDIVGKSQFVLKERIPVTQTPNTHQIPLKQITKKKRGKEIYLPCQMYQKNIPE